MLNMIAGVFDPETGVNTGGVKYKTNRTNANPAFSLAARPKIRASTESRILSGLC